MNSPPRVVFDCVILLQAAARPEGPARRCLEMISENQAILYASHDTLFEAKDVLNRPKIRSRFPELTDEAVADFLRLVSALSTLVPDVPPRMSLPRDPKDEPYVNLALAVDADYLVTRDQDLLDLMADPEFCGKHPGLRVLEPVGFLAAIQSPRTGEQEGMAP